MIEISDDSRGKGSTNKTIPAASNIKHFSPKVIPQKQQQNMMTTEYSAAQPSGGFY